MIDFDDILIVLILLLCAVLHGEVSRTTSRAHEITDSAIFGENNVVGENR